MLYEVIVPASLGMSASGQKAKYSLRADVFRYSPNSRHSAKRASGHAEAVLRYSDNSGMRHGRRDRPGRPLGERLKCAIGTAEKPLDDRGRQYPLALADPGDVVAPSKTPRTSPRHWRRGATIGYERSNLRCDEFNHAAHSADSASACCNTFWTAASCRSGG
jgi:hypothetical protein